MIQRGYYNPQVIEQRAESTLRAHEIEQREYDLIQREAKMEGDRHVAEIAAKHGPLDQATREAIMDYLHDHLMRTGETLTILQAFGELVKAGKVRPGRAAQPSPRKLADQIRRQSAGLRRPGAATPGASQPTRDELAAEAFAALHGQ
jgi:hypothetical protein